MKTTVALYLLLSASVVSARKLRGWPYNRAADGPCNGRGYYTVHINGEKRTVCMGDTLARPSDPNRGKGGGDEAVPIGGGAEAPMLPNETCTKENWNLEGNGAGFECSSNDDCKYGCCGTGQVAGKCISPYINPSFASFMGCMPEFSKCEVNRAGLEPPPSGPTTEPEFAFGIGTCQPGAKVSGRVTECCTSSFDCQNYGYNRVKVSACCDKHRMQCVPEGVLEGMQDIVCL
mmetsp:Transcript_20555/g.44928  ORF Transcript_20555/g.44928 Transcript_20555/m.44928 type:complete len:232 (-) Transcript_20555:139-834(-)